MAYSNNANLDGFLVTKSTFFNGTDFNNWKTRMDFYLKSIDYGIWYIVMHGDMVPMKKIDDRLRKLMRILMRKTKSRYLRMLIKAENYLICGLDRNIYNSVDQVSSAHEMWRMLEGTH